MIRAHHINILQQYSIPLIIGVIAGLVFANIDIHAYEVMVDYHIFGDDTKIFGKAVTVHFLVNEIFMVFFFGIATKEITESALPGGSLNPIRKAINPLMGTLGGVFGPAGLFFLLAWVFYGGGDDLGIVANGWGIPTATDIALAWLVARIVFGASHPAVSFLLLLAVADDAIGLGIIAVFYPDPEHPVAPSWLLLVAAG
ncbi:MAG: Na+/H+ antiporter NhaA, partial [Dehalococcoidia bacterium]|nr:Na+/H+ antiporter NhaA [Dehalococcoidia bacterium]